LRDRIALHARRTAAAEAIAAPGRRPLGYAALLAQIDATVAALNRAGIGRNDPVAIVLPAGAEMAAACVAVAAGATAAPLNPLYRARELDFALADLGVRALITEPGENAAADIARGLASPCSSCSVRAKTPPARSRSAPPKRDRRASPAPPARTMSLSCCTPPAPPGGRRSCR
jgi:acyl-CoA synthetase (AMP-forming)/AMP-acid ligase II